MSGHAPIAPSALYRTVQCPGWLRLAEAAPPEALADDDNEASAEGVAAHWAFAEILLGRFVAPGARAPNGVLVDDAMREAVDLGVDAVDDLIDEFRPPQGVGSLVVEQPVTIKRIHPQCWGTPDLRFWGAPRGPRHLLVVADYKHGYEFVDEFENLQTMSYSVGEIEERGLLDTQVEVVNAIIQPRSFHRDGPVRRWTYRGEDVRALVNIASSAAYEALGPNPQVRTGPACKHCPARLVCPAMTQDAGAARDRAHAAIPAAISPEGIGVELHFSQRALALLKARVDALQQQALALARAGRGIPGYSVEHSAGRLVWTKPAAEVIALGQMLGHNFAKPPEPITPTQAAEKGLPDPLLRAFATRHSGSADLVPDEKAKFRRVFAAGQR